MFVEEIGNVYLYYGTPGKRGLREMQISLYITVKEDGR
jgi:hypothetical protein